MRRFLTKPLAAIASMALLLNGCSGDTPSGPSGTGNGGSGTGGAGGGTCNVTIALQATSVTPLAGSAVIIRATARRNGQAIPDGSSIFFTTDFGFFLESGLGSVSKVVTGGVADVTLASGSSGTSHVRATFDCGAANLNVEFAAVPADGPFISTINPDRGSCRGGDIVTIFGGRFGNPNSQNTRVLFGGSPATIESGSDTAIQVRTPARTLANNSVPERVDVSIIFNSGTAGARTVTKVGGFLYNCVSPDLIIFISSVVPNNGGADGGETVVVSGGNFGTTIATTRITFGGAPATISNLTDTQATVLTPRRTLADPERAETVDVTITRDLGFESQQSATARQAYTYRGRGVGECGTTASLFISTVAPNTGAPAGGDLVTITGGGFGSNLSATRVEFGGRPAQVTAVSPNSITVSTPTRTLANPEIPESVEVVVRVDVGGPREACARMQNGFTYTRIALTPTIYSASPRTGPNDASTRVTLFGTGFQFPMQVFLTSPGCSGAQIEANVISIKEDTIVFLTPIASNGNICLANQLTDITVLNPATGKTAQCASCFKYYSCPTANGVSPQSGPYHQTNTVTITGSNFEEPVDVIDLSTGRHFDVISVSSSAIVVQIPPPDTVACGNQIMILGVSFPSLLCEPASVPFTITVPVPTVASATPTALNQDGSPLGSPLGSGSATITVNGSNYLDPMTIVLQNSASGSLDYTRVNNPSISNPETLTFPAPAIRDTDMNEQACVVGPGITGSRYVPTSFGILVRNARTTCTASLLNVLVYNPADASCRSNPVVTSGTPPSAAICSPYGPFQFDAAGGRPPYTWAASGLPTGMVLNAATGTLAGTPILAAPGAGVPAQGVTFQVTATDSLGVIVTKTYNIALTDPGAEFRITGAANQSVPAMGGFGSSLTASPNPTPAGFGPVTWTIDSVSPVPAVPFGQVPATGQTFQVFVPSGNLPGTYTVTVRATDTPSCGGAPHTTTFVVNMTKNP